MRNIILGVVAGLLLGTVGALAYSHYLGDGSLLADLQAKLDAANATLAKSEKDKKDLASETSGLTSQVDALQASNSDLKTKLVDAQKSTPATAAAPPFNPMALAGMMMNMFRGGLQGQQRMLLLKTRLHLTPEQTTAIQAAMDADAKARRELMGQMFRNGGKVDPQAAAGANTLDKTLASVLNADQQREYQQVQAEEKTSRADSMATMTVDQFAPLMQFTDAQREQVYNALYQIQSSAPDPMNLITSPDAAAQVAAQMKATNDALGKVLTPDQQALYQQAGQSMMNGGGFRQRTTTTGNTTTTSTTGNGMIVGTTTTTTTTNSATPGINLPPGTPTTATNPPGQPPVPTTAAPAATDTSGASPAPVTTGTVSGGAAPAQ